jgi:hypothetical protein
MPIVGSGFGPLLRRSGTATCKARDTSLYPNRLQLSDRGQVANAHEERTVQW